MPLPESTPLSREADYYGQRMDAEIGKRRRLEAENTRLREALERATTRRTAAVMFDLYVCPECDYHGISGVSGGVGAWPGDGKVRCPSRSCEYATVMEHRGCLTLSDDGERQVS